MKRKLWCIVYRTGGTDNFKWHRSCAFEYREESECYLKMAEVRRMGYPAYYVDYDQSVSIGLPETYEY